MTDSERIVKYRCRKCRQEFLWPVKHVAAGMHIEEES